jgi:SAM-dependent methyltransferase
MTLNPKDSYHRFGYEWKRYAEILDIYETQFRGWLPFLTPEEWKGKAFLDVGCGMGRNSYWPMAFWAACGRVFR